VIDFLVIILACKNTTYGNTCSFSCVEDTKLIGKDTSLKCKANGQWSPQKAFCVRYCAAPFLKDALLHNLQLSEPNRGQHYDMGYRCRYVLLTS